MTSPAPTVNAPLVSAPDEGGLNALARDRLAAGVDLYVACDANDDYLCAPRWIRIRLDQRFMARVLWLRALCVDAELNLVEAKGWPAACDDAGTAIKYWSLRADRHDFWYFGQPKDDGSVQSKMIKIDTLCEALNVELAPGQAVGYGNCFWYGAALVFTESHQADDFLALLDATFPELPARAREMEMASVLLEHKVAPAAQCGQAPVPRRRTPTI